MHDITKEDLESKIRLLENEILVERDYYQRELLDKSKRIVELEKMLYTAIHGADWS